MPEPPVLDVLLYGAPIGTLTLLPSGQSLFAFTRAYIGDENRPTLSLSYKDTMGGLITDVRPSRVRLPTFFSNLLPEGPLRAYLAERAGVKESREFALLSVLGQDLPGAITVRPAGGAAWGVDEADDDKPDATPARRAQAWRFSLAGVQLKFSAVLEAAGGLTIPAQGVGGSWIVKLPSPQFARVPENEYVMMRLAARIGIAVPEVRLVALSDIAGLPPETARLEGPALAVKRFDRREYGSPVHIEDFAQVFGVYPEDKYGKASYRDIARVLWAETGEAGIAEFIRRLVFCILTGNGDMHLKNWSLIYPDRRTPALSPGYDFVSIIPYVPDDMLALKLGRSRRMDLPSRDQLSYFAAKARLPERLVLRTAEETVDAFRAAWPEESRALPHAVLVALEAHVSRVASVKATS
ncbi:MAG: type II toxin-antitoxin system HipA family toxin [Alphaproteobacteria bacterium]|jgi:serine/threonine-protein kinase HipA|nr:type II toxin-antitoxin system HipA family toxin [Alphaproteobacteria bacterium]